MISYVRGFMALFILLTVLLHLPPGNSYQKYIHFFSELILTIALLTPILSIVCDSEKFLKMVDYEAFTEELAEVSKDMQQIEYLQSNYHREAYETAIAEDVKRIAEGYEFLVKDVSVELSEEYTVEFISLWVTKKEEEKVIIENIVFGDREKNSGGDIICSKLRQELVQFYQLDDAKIEIRYGDE